MSCLCVVVTLKLYSSSMVANKAESDSSITINSVINFMGILLRGVPFIISMSHKRLPSTHRVLAYLRQVCNEDKAIFKPKTGLFLIAASFRYSYRRPYHFHSKQVYKVGIAIAACSLQKVLTLTLNHNIWQT